MRRRHRPPHGSRSDQSFSNESGRGGHPKNLRGQQIGMWYLVKSKIVSGLFSYVPADRYAMRSKSRKELDERRLNKAQMELGESPMSQEQKDELRRQYQAEEKEKNDQELRKQTEREQNKPVGFWNWDFWLQGNRWNSRWAEYCSLRRKDLV